MTSLLKKAKSCFYLQENKYLQVKLLSSISCCCQKQLEHFSFTVYKSTDRNGVVLVILLGHYYGTDSETALQTQSMTIRLEVYLMLS